MTKRKQYARLELRSERAITIKGDPMKKETTREQPVKKAKTVELKLLIPYAILTLLATFSAGVVTGWYINIEQENQVKQQAQMLVKELATSKDQAQ